MTWSNDPVFISLLISLPGSKLIFPLPAGKQHPGCGRPDLAALKGEQKDPGSGREQKEVGGRLSPSDQNRHMADALEWLLSGSHSPWKLPRGCSGVMAQFCAEPAAGAGDAR